MKITWMHSHFLNWMGGHQYIFEICKRISDKHKVTVIASDADDYAVKQFNSIDVRLMTWKGMTTNNPLYWILLPLFVRREISKIKTLVEDDDLLITSYFPAHLWALGLSKPYIQILYEPLAFFYDEDFLKTYSALKRIVLKLIKYLYGEWDKSAVLRAKTVFTLSKHRANLVRKIYGRKDILVLEGGVDTAEFKKFAPISLCRKFQQKKIILHSTDFTATKGTDLLMRAISSVIKNNENTLLLITETVVSPSLKQKFLKLIAELKIGNNVKFIGKLKRKDLPKYMSLADMVVQPSRGQSLNLTVLEAMSCQTPVITCWEAGEHYTDGSAGFLIHSENIKLLSDKINYIFSHPAAARQMGRRGRRIILAKYSWDKTIQKLNKYLL